MKTIRRALRASFTVRRTLGAALVAILTAAILGGVIGFAVADDAPLEGLPARFGVAQPRVGDVVAYDKFSATQEVDGLALDPDSLKLRFERLPAAEVLDSHGRPRLAHLIHYMFFYKSATGNWTPLETLDAFDAVTGTVLARTHYDANSQHQTVSPSPTPGYEFVSNYAGWWNRTEMRPTSTPTGGHAFAHCGLRNALQEASWSVDRPIALFGGCPNDRASWDYAFGTDPAATYRAVGSDVSPFGPVVIFETVHPGNAWYGTSWVWFSPDIPYPVQVVFDGNRIDGKLSVYQLTEFVRGPSPLEIPTLSTRRPAAPPVARAPFRAWGLDESGIDHPWPFSQAYRYVLEDLNSSRLRDFLRDHPRAVLQYAHHETDYDDRQALEFTERKWKFLVSDGDANVPFALIQRTERVIGGGPLGLLPVSENRTSYRYEEVGALGYDHRIRSPPASAPSVASLFEIWKAHASPEYARLTPNSWGFWLSCLDESCSHVVATARAGVKYVRIYGRPAPGETQVYGEGWEGAVFLNETGLATGRLEAGSRNTMANAPTNSPSPWSTEQRIVPQSLHTRALWSFPTGAAAAATGLAALLAGLVYWLWPGIKSGATMPFYSRLDAPRALDHATRARMMALVESNPGIHFQEIVRRLELGQSTAEHHLRKLVEANMVSQAAGPRYTCYFAKGQADRAVMAAAPLLKSEGARRILRAMAAAPALSAAELAKRLLMTKQTIWHHLDRFAQAGLVEIQRDGHSAIAKLTPAGRAASEMGDPST